MAAPNPLRIIEIEHLRDLHEDLVLMSATMGTPKMGEWTETAVAGWESIIGAIKMRVQYGAYDSVACSAAAFLCHGATTQHLTDGNKRMSTAAMNMQLMWNGYEFIGVDDTLIDFTMLIAMTRSTDLERVTAVAGAYLDRNISPINKQRHIPFTPPSTP